MTTKLEAINTMLSCIGQAPLNTLEGTKSYFTVAAEQILDSDTETVQLQGWDFNTEDNYPFAPDENNEIKVSDNVLMIDVDNQYNNRYTIREGKLYDKLKHTYKIEKSLKCSVVWKLKFEDLPEVAKKYVTMSAAYKFVKRELGAEKISQFTQEDLVEARIALMQHELEIGDYTMIPQMYDGRIRSWL